jgi:4-hydroxy-L-threonine phosphate dehydrogenase PdxA
MRIEVIRKKNRLNKINLIDVNFKQTSGFSKITPKSNHYIASCFDIAINLLKNNVSNKFINGPISKKTFLKKKFNGITEYLAHRTKTKNFAMIIYNKNLSVCPLTTHLPIKYVNKKINRLDIINKVKLINIFWKKKFGKQVRIGVTGLNPHCESIDSFNEDQKIILPTIKKLQKLKYNIKGPLAADTIFLKVNRKKFDLIIGMYHDQVLTPIKTLFEYDAINITIGLPFIRVSPDHGPNESMLGKNKSNYLSLLNSIKFLDF